MTAQTVEVRPKYSALSSACDDEHNIGVPVALEDGLKHEAEVLLVLGLIGEHSTRIRLISYDSFARKVTEPRSAGTSALCSRLLNPLAYDILTMFNILYRSSLMDAISYTAARTNLAKTMEQVCEDHSPVIITRSKSPSVVMISLEDYEALQETAYLLRAPKNARRLLESVAELEQGGGQEKELLE